MMDHDVKRIGDLRIAACGLSFSDQIGLVVQKGFGAAHTLIKNEAIDVLQLTMKSLNDERNNVISWDSNRSDPMREQIYGLCEALELILKYKIISYDGPCFDNKQEVHVNEIENVSVFANQAFLNDFEPNHDLNSGIFDAGQLEQPIQGAAENIDDEIDNQCLVGVPKLEDTIFDELQPPFVDQVKLELENSLMEENVNETFLDEPSMEEMEGDENDFNLSTEDDTDNEDTVEEMNEPIENNNVKFAQIRKKSHEIVRKDKHSKLKTRQNKRHRNSTGPHKCNECGIAYRHKRNLQDHIRIKHTGTDEQQFQCDKCNRRFDRKDSFKRHMNLHSTKQPEKAFTCQTCGEGFVYHASLWKHTKKHSNDVTVRKPYSCDTCGTRFAEKHHLKNHATRYSH